jgi:hypothetical protein
MKVLQGSHTAERVPTLPGIAVFPGKTACKNSCAHARFILTHMRFLSGGMDPRFHVKRVMLGRELPEM